MYEYAIWQTHLAVVVLVCLHLVRSSTGGLTLPRPSIEKSVHTLPTDDITEGKGGGITVPHFKGPTLMPQVMQEFTL